MTADEADRHSTRRLAAADWFAHPNNRLPFADVGGTLRTHFRGLTSTRVRTSLIVLPIGQCSPVHTSKIEHVITVLEGAVEFIVDGAHFRLEKLDQLFIPAGLAFEYRNVALQYSWFFNVISPADEWPEGDTATYEPPEQ